MTKDPQETDLQAYLSVQSVNYTVKVFVNDQEILGTEAIAPSDVPSGGAIMLTNTAHSVFTDTSEKDRQILDLTAVLKRGTNTLRVEYEKLDDAQHTNLDVIISTLTAYNEEALASKQDVVTVHTQSDAKAIIEQQFSLPFMDVPIIINK